MNIIQVDYIFPFLILKEIKTFPLKGPWALEMVPYLTWDDLRSLQGADILGRETDNKPVKEIISDGEKSQEGNRTGDMQ